MKVLLLLAAVVAIGQAHLCLVFPKQRGNITGLNMAGADNCLLVKDAPCGGRPAEMPEVTFESGMNATIIFQKNLDHWVMATPGMFEINLWGMKGKMNLMTVPDMGPNMGQPSGTLYTVSVPMPKMEMEKAILQVVYITKNPMAPAMFYQCADVNVMMKR
ncbi:uncharacterized protein LOC135331808 [Halichondria panicea]|uniref:uncharacterized protein LOC135331808 n=1 Tax=Halichondria panicea TaxID=6063 RepID=UPI00312BC3EE